MENLKRGHRNFGQNFSDERRKRVIKTDIKEIIRER